MSIEHLQLQLAQALDRVDKISLEMHKCEAAFAPTLLAHQQEMQVLRNELRSVAQLADQARSQIAQLEERRRGHERRKPRFVK